MRIEWISASITKISPRLLSIPVLLIEFPFEISALVDSGATVNLIHDTLVSKLNIPTYSCPPVKILEASGRILSYSQRKVCIRLANDPYEHEFLVAPIGIYSMILGMPWLETTNPIIDWKARTLRFGEGRVSPVAGDIFEQTNANGDLGTPGIMKENDVTFLRDQADPHTNFESQDSRLDSCFVSPGNNSPNPASAPDIMVPGTTSGGDSEELSTNTPEPPPRQTNRRSPRKRRPKRRRSLSTNPPLLSAANSTPLGTESTPKCRLPKPLVGLTRKIGQNDQIFLVYLDSVISVNELVTSLIDTVVEKPPSSIPVEYQDLAEVFSEDKANELPPPRGDLDHAIPLEEGSKPVYGPIYNLSENELKALREYLDENMRKGFIRPSTSPFGSPVLFVKKPDGSLRLVIDYRALNRMTVKNRYPLPLISEMLDRLVGAKYFTKLDGRNAYNTLRMAPGHEYKTAFRTRYGHFEYLVMPFGLTNAPASFQSFINNVLRPYLDTFVIVYLDDILVFTNGTLQEHIAQVRLVLQELLVNGIHCKAEKCQFHAQKISFLGYVVSPEGVSMDPDRVSTIAEWPVPESVHDTRVFLGFANFYR